jgi:hypothetical protein
MDTCGEGADRPQYVPILYRDGLLIALLIACPMRIKNLANLIIGQHLVLDGCAYGLKAQGRGDQDRQALRACVPNELTGYIDEWLWFHRPALAINGSGGRKRRQRGGPLVDRSLGPTHASRRSSARSGCAPDRPSAKASARTCSATSR